MSVNMAKEVLGGIEPDAAFFMRPAQGGLTRARIASYDKAFRPHAAASLYRAVNRSERSFGRSGRNSRPLTAERRCGLTTPMGTGRKAVARVSKLPNTSAAVAWLRGRRCRWLGHSRHDFSPA